MPDPAKAELRELDADFQNEINRDKWTSVQFNPESLKVTFANQIQQPSGGGDQRGAPAQLFVGAGTTKLACQLWFDVTAPQPEQPAGQSAPDDVRRLTAKVAYFITPQQRNDKFVPPAVRFIWGSFQFDGIVEGMEESLEFFSPEGKPLRASIALTLSQQKITEFVFRPTEASAAPPGNQPPAGTRPQTPVTDGQSVQGMAAQSGRGGNWQSIAAANNIENPRLPSPGLLIDLNVSVRGPRL